LENGGREAAERIATVEKHGLAITRQHCDILALGVGNGKTIEVDPITGEAVRRLLSRHDRELLQRSRKLGYIDTAKDNRASALFNATEIKTERPAVDPALIDHIIKDKRIRAVPAIQIRAGTQNTDRDRLAVVGNTDNLLN
jgi:hypothetical protein